MTRSCWLFLLLCCSGLLGLPTFLEWHEEHQVCLLRSEAESVSLSSAMVECRDLPYVDFFRGILMHPDHTLLTAPLTNLSAAWSTAQTELYFKALESLSSAVFEVFKDSDSERRRPMAVLALPPLGATSSAAGRRSRSKPAPRRLHSSSKDDRRGKSPPDRRSVPIFPLVFPAVPAAAVHFQVPPKAQHLFSSASRPLNDATGPQVPPNRAVWQSVQQSTFVGLFDVDVDAAADPGASCRGLRGQERLEAQRRLVLAMAAGTLPLLQRGHDRCARGKTASLSPALLPPALRDALGLVQAHQRAALPRDANALLRYEELDRRFYAALAMALQQFARTALTTRAVVGHVLALTMAADGADDVPHRVALLSMGAGGDDAVLTAVVHGLHDLYAATVHFSAAAFQRDDAAVRLLVWPRRAISALLREETDARPPEAAWGAAELRRRFEDAALPLSALAPTQEASTAAELVAWLQSAAPGGLLAVSVPRTGDGDGDGDAALWSAVSSWACASGAGRHLALLFSGWTLSEAERVAAERLADVTGGCARVTVFLA
eukprot:gene12418-8886_t